VNERFLLVERQREDLGGDAHARHRRAAVALGRVLHQVGREAELAAGERQAGGEIDRREPGGRRVARRRGRRRRRHRGRRRRSSSSSRSSSSRSSSRKRRGRRRRRRRGRRRRGRRRGRGRGRRRRSSRRGRPRRRRRGLALPLVVGGLAAGPWRGCRGRLVVLVVVVLVEALPCPWRRGASSRPRSSSLRLAAAGRRLPLRSAIVLLVRVLLVVVVVAGQPGSLSMQRQERGGRRRRAPRPRRAALMMSGLCKTLPVAPARSSRCR
jgi:hypothetical protein